MISTGALKRFSFMRKVAICAPLESRTISAQSPFPEINCQMKQLKQKFSQQVTVQQGRLSVSKPRAPVSRVQIICEEGFQVFYVVPNLASEFLSGVATMGGPPSVSTTTTMTTRTRQRHHKSDKPLRWPIERRARLKDSNPKATEV